MTTVPLYIPLNDLDKYFYNRKKDLERIEYYLNSLENDISQRLLIRGYRGVGKTFLLQKIKHDAKNNYIVSYIDISRVFGQNYKNLTVESLLLELLDSMNQSIYEKTNNQTDKITFLLKSFLNNFKLKDIDFNNSLKIGELSIPATEDNYKKISKFVMEYPQKVVENMDGINGFIIIIDEFQMLKKLDNLEAFFWLLRSYSQFQSNVSYVMSGSISRTADIIEMINGATGAFGGRMIQINIDPFTKEETKSYFNDKFSEIKFTEGGFDKFYDYTKGIPMYINSFYNLLSSDVIYDEQLVEDTFIQNMDQILVMWIKIWGSLNKNEKKIIYAILPNESITWTELESRVDLSTATINKYLNTLQNKGILSFINGRYHFEDLMLKTWIENEVKVNGVYP